VSDYVVTLEIGRRRVVARTPKGAEKEGELDLDDLRLSTIDVLGALVRENRLNKAKEFEILGSHLYRAVLNGAVESLVETKRKEARRADERLLLQLQFESDALSRLPWEYLFKPGAGGYFLSTNFDLRLARFTNRGDDDEEPDPPDGQLRVLLCLAEPGAESETNDAREVRRLPELVSSIELKETTGERDALMKSVEKEHPHVLHFIGQGRFEGDGQTGEIALLNEHGEAKWLNDTLFAELFGLMSQPPRLVVLHLAESEAAALPGKTWSFSRVAPLLVLGNVDTVVAMHYPIDSAPAREFCATFYRKLAEGAPVAEAVQEGRRSTVYLKTDYATRAFGSPVLYMHRKTSEIIRPSPQEEEDGARNGLTSTPEKVAHAMTRTRGESDPAIDIQRGPGTAPPSDSDPRSAADQEVESIFVETGSGEHAMRRSAADEASASYVRLIRAAAERAEELRSSPGANSARLRVVGLRTCPEAEQISKLFGWASGSQDPDGRSVFSAAAACAVVNALDVGFPAEDARQALEGPLAEMIDAAAGRIATQPLHEERKRELDGRLSELMLELAPVETPEKLGLLLKQVPEESAVQEPDWVDIVVDMTVALEAGDGGV
jgi:hypothetical protein